MKTRYFFLAVLAAAALLTGCKSSRGTVVEEISDDGLLLNDELVAVRTDDGKVSIKNATTGKITIKDIQLDWTAPSRNDSLAVFCSESGPTTTSGGIPEVPWRLTSLSKTVPGGNFRRKWA